MYAITSNSTACPGEGVVNRFNELISPVPYYDAVVTGQSHTSTISLRRKPLIG